MSGVDTSHGTLSVPRVFSFSLAQAFTPGPAVPPRFSSPLSGGFPTSSASCASSGASRPLYSNPETALGVTTDDLQRKGFYGLTALPATSGLPPGLRPTGAA